MVNGQGKEQLAELYVHLCWRQDTAAILRCY